MPAFLMKLKTPPKKTKNKQTKKTKKNNKQNNNNYKSPQNHKNPHQEPETYYNTHTRARTQSNTLPWYANYGAICSFMVRAFAHGGSTNCVTKAVVYAILSV